MFYRFLPWNPKTVADILERRAHFPIDVTDKDRQWKDVDDVRRPTTPWRFLEAVHEPDDSTTVINEITHNNLPSPYDATLSRNCAVVKKTFLTPAHRLLHFDSLQSLRDYFPDIDLDRAGERFSPGWYNLLTVEADTDYIVGCPSIPFKDSAARLESQSYVFEWAVALEKYSATICSTSISENEDVVTLDIEHNSVDRFKVGSVAEDTAVIECVYRTGVKTLAASSTDLSFPSRVRKLVLRMG